MPELPEVETVCRGLRPVMEGARFVRVEQRRPDLRFPFPKNFNKRLEGASVEGLNRRAKYLLEAKGLVRVELTIFGRPVPVELEYWQVEHT